ncbi:uroporphyrinogen-III C-methyltransferase [Alkalicoccus urumqiensis]|uniref:Uroporphyrinogen-III C-methyltransferase n=1 Tax=Alkalicoccus urumqiensis TaxID=1548213 RepID=A0A2P6MIB0_ALKUR|nr:uroporphyrinogen-III C-methyltransferase [Alkalicoccus urumqiensis]PRO66024.1 uroporphyrinogen-III C-methyltransferase [Alkalicoccus urumqiensis]
MKPVAIVGAGPGDPELITVKGLKAIQRADVILYDRLVSEELLHEAKPGAELIYCGKKPYHHSMKQEEINEQLCLHAEAGLSVTRLKGGDPFVFGRGGEEAQALRARGIPFDICPGVTSGTAAPAYAGIPVTHRDHSSSVAFIAAVSKMDDDDYWKHVSSCIDTLCIYMGVSKLAAVCEKLREQGKAADTPAALISWGTTGAQSTVTGTLETIAERASGAEQPAMIVIGEVVRLRSELAWIEEKAAAVVS